MSIGQEISVTALQLVTAVSAIANGGRLLEPRIVRAELDSHGGELRVTEPHVVRQVISPDTARTLTGIMSAVVRDGTGHKAALPGYEVAGKTGTAQKMDPATRRYSRAPGVLSFVGFAPADDPRLTMLVMLDEPRTEKWGSEAAAPIFAAIAQEALRHMNVPPRDTTPVALVRGELATAAAVVTPAAAFDAAAIRFASFEEDQALAIMPLVQGLSLRGALDALAAFDVRVVVTGRGIVVTQVPAPGTVLAPGTVCRLALASPAAGR
jgi:cell division protein FtsI (penicillin-binding protein 3)